MPCRSISANDAQFVKLKPWSGNACAIRDAASRPAGRQKFDSHLCNVHNAHMSVKTVSLKLEAYERLRAARRYPTESFSAVVLRATWPEDTLTARELLDRGRARRAGFSDVELDRIDALKRRDAPPEDKWASR